MSDEDRISYQAEIEQLGSLRSGWRAVVAQQLKMWAIRWAIGFAIIAAIYAFNPEWTWLWWWGLGLALALPVATLAVTTFFTWKIKRNQQQWSDLEEWVNSLDDEADPAD